MAVTWDKALYDAAYSSFRPDREYHYERTVAFNRSLQHAQNMIVAFGLDGTHRVVIFGCGFDWTGEALRSLGIDAIGSDTSAYIQSEWDSVDPETSSDKKPLNENGGNGGSRNKIKQEFAGNNDPTHVFSEDIMTALSDAEILDLAQWDSFTDAIIAHSITALYPGKETQQQGDWPLWNWKTEADWRLFFNGIGLGHHRIFHPAWGREY